MVVVVVGMLKIKCSASNERVSLFLPRLQLDDHYSYKGSEPSGRARFLIILWTKACHSPFGRLNEAAVAALVLSTTSSPTRHRPDG